MRSLGAARGLVVLVALLTSLALFTGMTGEAAGAVRPKLSESGKQRRPKAQETKPIKGRVLKSREARLPGQKGTPAGQERPKPSWPAGGQETAGLSKITDRPTAPPWVRVGELPVWLTAPAPRRGARTGAGDVPSEVSVRIAGRDTARAARTDGLMLALAAEEPGRVKIGVNYGAFRTAYGGDWASRLRLVKLPACALTTPDKRECQRGTPLPTVNDAKTATLSADVDVPAGELREQTTQASGMTVLAAEAGPSGPGGDWTATSLNPASSWSAGSNTGEFSWSYPLRVPPVPGDLLPEISIGYNSGSVDGKTAADNSQASWIGDGFDYWPGFIERKYKACIDDGQTSGDLCWGRSNAFMSLNGRATELIYDSSAGYWRPKNDDGTRVERLTGATNGDNDGEWWQVTTLDGTRYIFGKDRPDDWTSGAPETNSAWTVPVYGDDSGEPCHGSTFKDSKCYQAWRWNLDHVIDPHRNTITYFYAKETNNYTTYDQWEGGTKYVSGGHLKQIDYGQRQGLTYAVPATARVRFDVADRTDYPDDQVCADDEDCGLQKLSPTFFDRKRLTRITTELLTDRQAGTYSPVDVWNLVQTYQNGVLWPSSVHQTGNYGGQVFAPQITLTGQLMTNRVVTDRSGTGVDNLPPHYRPRLVGVDNGTGSTTSISYSDPYPVGTDPDPGECRYADGAMPTPKSNTKRCFPVKWRNPGGDIVNDWYHKYVVTSVSESDVTGLSRLKLTSYQYLGGGAWRYTEDDGLTKDQWRHWSQWRGYAKVRTIGGSGTNGELQSRTETTYARGMDGNYQGKGAAPLDVTVTDSKNLLGGVEDIDVLAGTVIEERTFNGSFTDADEITATVSKPRWQETVSRTFKDTITDDDITVRGGWVKTQWTKDRTRQSDGSDRYTETYLDYDDLGRTVAVDDEGDPATASDDTCARTVYPSGTAGGTVIRALPIRQLHVAVDCDNAASSEPNLVAGDMISDVKTIYDGGQYGDHPTKGDDRQVETVTGVSEGRSVVTKAVTNVHDMYGRVTSTTQVGDPSTTADDRTTTSTYDQADEGWVRSSTVTTPPVSVNGGTPAGFTTTTEYNPARGTPTKVTDPNGRVAEAVYDGLGRIVKSWLPDNLRSSNPDRPSTIYTYVFPTDGNPVSIATETLTKTSPVTYETSVELLDGLLRPRQSQTEAPGGGRLVSDTVYDSRGLVFKANAPYPMAGAPSRILTSADDNQVPSQTITAYDAAGRPVTSTLYSKSTRKWATTTQYDGERTVTIPPTGAMPTMSITDARGRTVETRQYKTSNLSGAYIASTYSYDGAGRPHELRDGAGNVWRATYDVQGRPSTSTDPDKGTSSLTYDDFDQVKTTTDARGTTLTYTYDRLGRKTEVKNGSTLLTSYTYDTLPSAKGLPASATRHIGNDAYVTAVRGYDIMYRSRGSIITIPQSEGALAGTYTTAQTYNFDGSPDLTSYPGVASSTGGLPAEDVITYYDDNGLPERNGGLATYVADTVYNSFGEVSQLALASVSDRFIWQNFDRDEATKRITRTTVKRQTSAATYDVENIYDYTDSGSIRSILTNSVGRSADRQCFTYDYAQRLTQAWTTNQANCNTAPSSSTIGGPAPYWTSYEYQGDGEKTGNRTKETQHSFAGGLTTDKVRTYSYPASAAGSGPDGPHALKSVTEVQGSNTRTDLYTYDEAGNTLTRPGQKLVWDAEGNLSKVTNTSNAELAGFVYDASGNRLIRKDTNGKTLYLPGQELKVSTTGATSAIRYYSHGGQIVAYRTGASTSSVQFVLPDYQGTANTTINAVSQNTWSLRNYAPFGAERGGGIGTWPTVMDKGFVGGTKDTTTGLTHLGAREYDPSIGRFVSVDPVFAGGDPTTWNGFGYAANNPIDNSDPDGLACRIVSGYKECSNPPGHGLEDTHRSGGVGSGGSPGSGGQAGCIGSCYIPRTPAPPVKPPCTSWVCKTGKFLKKHSATIVATTASVAVGVGCGAAIGWTGVGGVACAAAAGAVFGAVHHGMSTPRDQWSATGFLKAGAVGAVTGVATHGAVGLAAKAAAPLIQRVAPNIAGKLRIGGGGKGGSSGGKGNATAKPAATTARPSSTSSGAGRGCVGSSFVPGTQVVMANGTRKPIDELQVGDKVLATDPDTGRTGPQTVVSTVSSAGSKNLVRVTVDVDGDRGSKTGVVVATDNHPFWIPATKQWTQAGKLKPGMWLRTSAGTHVQITAIKTRTTYQRVHNLTVDTDHTYHVSAGSVSILVSNCGTQVTYGSTDLSQAVLEARVLDGSKSANTYAAARYEDSSGELRTLVVNSDAGGHAEPNMIDRLAELNISSSSVKELYVEYQPCARCGANYIPLYTNAEITWSFVWNSDKVVQAAARKARAAAINDIWGK
ncbi:RHS repeat-associated core domain-containing protein [Thermomonospora echinospora]|uniref:RHS repeat-associated core domain-containing protein n=2 Tax=Thermomonospora echinospora TaxID=1992 RepID=A0A1H6E197_9ACTN|nr:RHS repeat-associated core domain-containing protein [Thermomonospora echinospora]